MDAEFAEEHDMLARRRTMVGRAYAGAREEPDPGVLPDAAPFPEQSADQWAQGAMAGRPYLALAFSGGGIRSATFSLGVLQAVAQAPCGSAVVWQCAGAGQHQAAQAGAGVLQCVAFAL